jgi:hypothetical protein
MAKLSNVDPNKRVTKMEVALSVRLDWLNISEGTTK